MAVARVFETHKRASNPGNESLQVGAQMRIEIVPVSKVRPIRRNAHQHSKKQIRQIANSIAQFRFINPVIVDDEGNVVAGFGRLAAAELLRMRTVPVIRVSHLSETELRAYMLTDNKLTENAGWHRDLLAVELKELEVSLPEIGLELGITGFEPAEIDSLMVESRADGPNPVDEIPPLEQKPVVSQLGDLFVLNRHRLIVGDPRDPHVYGRLMGTDLAEMAFLDPPHDVKIAAQLTGTGQIKHGEFVCASGAMSAAEYTSFLEQTLGLCARHTADGAIHYICMDWRHAPELLAAGAGIYHELKNICVWIKSDAGQGSFYRNRHEFVFVYKHGRGRQLNTLGPHRGSRTNVWNYRNGNRSRAGRMDDLRTHPMAKPAALVVDAMRDCSRRGSIVLDTFAASGTTIIAAEQIGRRAFCLELDPAYVDVAIRRWQRLTGRNAVLEAAGQTFDELSDNRVRKVTNSGSAARSHSLTGRGGR